MVIGLTGGTGFIGQCLLKEHGGEHEFRVLYRSALPDEHVEAPSIGYIASDYSLEAMKEAFSGCDAIVHLGGLLATKEREASLLNYGPNIESAEAVFAAAAELGIKNVVNASSRLVYDTGLPSPHSEDEPLSPANKYGIAKLATENLAAVYNRERGLAIKSLRFAQVFGNGGRNGYMMSVFREKCESGEPIEVFDKQGKELIYVKDATDAIMAACLNGDEGGAYNIGSGVFHTNMEIAEAFLEAYGNKEGIIDKSRADEMTVPNYMDVSKAEKAFGFKAGHSLAEAIADMRKDNAR